MEQSGLNSSRWLDAVWNPNTQIYALPNGLKMFDVTGDGDAKLIVADLRDTTQSSTKIRVFKGADEITQQIVSEIPCSIVGFYTETGGRKSAVLAVGAGSNVFIFKNLRPHFKFSLPHLNADNREQDIWYKASLEDELNVFTLIDDLKFLLEDVGAANLSSRTLKLLSLKSDMCQSFAEQYRLLPVIKTNTISIIGAIRKDSWAEIACSYLIIGTEFGEILIMDHRAFFVVDKHIISWAPVTLATSGLWGGDGQIVLVGRDGEIGSIKRGSKFQHWETLSAPAIALTTLTNEDIAVATMNGSLWAFSNKQILLKGIKLWKVQLGGYPLDMASLPVPQIGLSLLAVSIARYGVRIYDQKHQVDTINMFESISSIKYGRLGQEERAFAMVTFGGGLSVKILKRTADFSVHHTQHSTYDLTNAQPKSIIPKKTKLFIEQTIRERSEAINIHTTFQQGFLRLSLNVANKARKILISKESTKSIPITLQSSIIGFGPNYRIKITITHLAEGFSNKNLYLVIRGDKMIVKPRFIKVPLVVTGIPFSVTFSVIPKLTFMKKMQILLYFRGQVKPLIILTVVIPITEPDIEV